MGWPVGPDFWWGLATATVIAVVATLRLRIHRADEFRQMNWMDWCGYYGLVGVFTILVSALIGWAPLSVAGVLLLVPLYPLAILGLIGKLDDMRVSFLRGLRKR